MINIRYHIVSITAVFLALGIGVALGSTFLDDATVGRLDANITAAQARIDATEAENAELREQVELAEQRDLAQLAASQTILGGRLEDRPVLLVAAPGVDQANLDALTLILTNADADLRGTLALRPELAFDDGVDEALVEALDLTARTPEAQRAEVHDLLVDALVAAGAPAEDPDGTGDPDDPEDPTTTTTTAPGTPTVPGETTLPGDTTLPAPSTAPGATTAPGDTTVPGATPAPGETTTTLEDDAAGEETDEVTVDGETPEVLTALVEADLVDVLPGPDRTAEDPLLEQTGYQYVYVTQPGLEPADDRLLLSLLPPEETDPPLPAVVVSPTDDRTEEAAAAEDEVLVPSAVAQVRASDDLARLYDTVDDIDTYIGLQSVVLVLDAPESAAAGHYGQGEGATALMPAGS